MSAFESTVSPCIGVCRLDEAREHCTGCLRTLAEIAGWSTLDDRARRALLVELRERRQRASGGGIE